MEVARTTRMPTATLIAMIMMVQKAQLHGRSSSNLRPTSARARRRSPAGRTPATEPGRRAGRHRSRRGLPDHPGNRPERSAPPPPRTERGGGEGHPNRSRATVMSITTIGRVRQGAPRDGPWSRSRNCTRRKVSLRRGSGLRLEVGEPLKIVIGNGRFVGPCASCPSDPPASIAGTMRIVERCSPIGARSSLRVLETHEREHEVRVALVAGKGSGQPERHLRLRSGFGA